MDSKSSSGGIGIVGVLTIVFVVLKLVGTISWSWWWVLSPLWIATGLWIVLVLIFGIGALLIGAVVKKR